MKTMLSSLKISAFIIGIVFIIVIVMHLLCFFSINENPYLSSSKCKFQGMVLPWCKQDWFTREKGMFPKCMFFINVFNLNYIDLNPKNGQ